MAALVVRAEEMTFEEFLVAYDGVSAEWVGGRVRVEDLSGRRRSQLKRFVGTVLQTWAESRQCGEVYLAPMAVRLSESVALEPDVFFVRTEHAERVRQTHVEGAPDLVVDILSRGTRNDVRGTRFYDYEAAGVPEIWVIDADRRVAEAWRLGEDGRYDVVQPGRLSVLESRSLPGARIAAEWLWRDPLPRQTEIQKAWGLI